MSKEPLEKTELERQWEAEAEAEAEARAAAEQAQQTAQDDAAEEPPAEAGPPVDVSALTAERDELKDQLLRSRAEFINYRKRTAREVERIRKTAAEGLVRDILPVLDNLERALAHATGDAAADAAGLAEGVEMVLKQLCGVLSQHGIAPIPALGERFDPNLHEAVVRLPSTEYAADMVMQEFQTGYRMGDFVLRPTKTGVSAGPPEAQDVSDTGGDVPRGEGG